MTQRDPDGDIRLARPEGGNAKGKARKSDRRRTEIIHHAHKLFETKGFQNTSLGDIARKVGIKREGLYYYFKNPTEILLSIARPRIERLIARLVIIVESGLHPESKLYLAIHSHLQLFDRTSLDTIVLGTRGDYRQSIGFVHKHMSPLYNKYQELWIELVREGRERGVFVDIGPAKMVVFAILGMCNWMGRWYDPKKPVTLDDLAGTFFAVSASGMLMRGNGSSGRKVLRPARQREVDAFMAQYGPP